MGSSELTILPNILEISQSIETTLQSNSEFKNGSKTTI
ncbi:hypothetical protein AM1_D0218 (plasmid) [Acaryochloris marina MBIC11017]|uniref:Uncharacterized protein n=1 Tax=Acaryochloris marina (strain MBIC 11017) TaxID=329726 RepID=A8ZNX7_ACAM1|nr:hypothetical protein AM1_D0218 [Acaryochloris marina MBIC11017]